MNFSSDESAQLFAALQAASPKGRLAQHRKDLEFLRNKIDCAEYEKRLDLVERELTREDALLLVYLKEADLARALLFWEIDPNTKAGEDSRKGGRKGGAADKRRRWADMLAAHLKAAGARSRQEAWELIPDSAAPLELEAFGADLVLYRDGNRIICLAGGRERSLTASTFFSTYFKVRAE